VKLPNKRRSAILSKNSDIITQRLREDDELQVLDLLRASLGSELVIVSVGGVETAEDVRERVAHGANLVQGYTGFVYEGPLWARKIKKGMQ